MYIVGQETVGILRLKCCWVRTVHEYEGARRTPTFVRPFALFCIPSKIPAKKRKKPCIDTVGCCSFHILWTFAVQSWGNKGMLLKSLQVRTRAERMKQIRLGRGLLSQTGRSSREA